MAIVLICLPLAVCYYLHYVRCINYKVFEWYDYHLNDISKTQLTPKSIRSLLLTYFLLLLTSIILNIEHLFAEQDEKNFAKYKCLLAWTFYVILHATTLAVTVVYLYVFHAPDTLKCFSLLLVYKT